MIGVHLFTISFNLWFVDWLAFLFAGAARELTALSSSSLAIIEVGRVYANIQLFFEWVPCFGSWSRELLVDL